MNNFKIKKMFFSSHECSNKSVLFLLVSHDCDRYVARLREFRKWPSFMAESSPGELLYHYIWMLHWHMVFI